MEDADQFADELDDAASDESASPADRIAALRRLKDRISAERATGDYRLSDMTDLLGQADRYIGDLELRREAHAMGQQIALATARENADIRDLLIADRVATPEDLAGMPSHTELDAAQEDGSLVESVLGELWVQAGSREEP